MSTKAGREMIETARSLGDLIREHAAEGDAIRQLPDVCVEAMRDAGLFRLWLPQSLGGPDIEPIESLRVVEEISRADASAGWILMIGAESNTIVACHIQEESARELFPLDKQVIIGGRVGPGPGTADREPGGYRVSGRWRFGSGVTHADWMYANCEITNAAGKPEMLLVVVPKSEFTVLDTWDTIGLRGTGSHDYTIDDVFVPDAHTFTIAEGPRDRTSLIPALPFLGHLALTKPPIAIGIALDAIDYVVDLAATKTKSGGTALLRESSQFQRTIADATTKVLSARAYVESAVRDIAVEMEGGKDPSMLGRAHLRLACANGVAQAADAVDMVYKAAGTSSIPAGNPLERAFRDIHTLTQHVNSSQAVVEPAGRVLLGLEPDWPLF